MSKRGKPPEKKKKKKKQDESETPRSPSPATSKGRERGETDNFKDVRFEEKRHRKKSIKGGRQKNKRGKFNNHHLHNKRRATQKQGEERSGLRFDVHSPTITREGTAARRTANEIRVIVGEGGGRVKGDKRVSSVGKNLPLQMIALENVCSRIPPFVVF